MIFSQNSFAKKVENLKEDGVKDILVGQRREVVRQQVLFGRQTPALAPLQRPQLFQIQENDARVVAEPRKKNGSFLEHQRTPISSKTRVGKREKNSSGSIPAKLSI